MKLRFYRLTEARIKRIIRHPARVEEGIIEGAVACMQPAFATAVASAGKPSSAPTLSGFRAGKPVKNYSEIWTLYVLSGGKQKKIKIISAWRYPGKSPERDPIPQEVLNEIRRLVVSH